MLKKKFLVNLFKFHPFKKSLSVAIEGITYLFTYHRNMRIIFITGVITFIFGILLHLSHFEIAILCLTIVLVFIAEMFNTAIELVIDLFTDKQYHVLVKVVKDIAAGVVLIASINAIVVGYFLFWKRVIALFI